MVADHEEFKSMETGQSRISQDRHYSATAAVRSHLKALFYILTVALTLLDAPLAACLHCCNAGSQRSFAAERASARMQDCNVHRNRSRRPRKRGFFFFFFTFIVFTHFLWIAGFCCLLRAGARTRKGGHGMHHTLENFQFFFKIFNWCSSCAGAGGAGVRG